MIFGNLYGDQAGFLFWAEKALKAHSYAEFVKWPIGPGGWQDLRALDQEAPYLYTVFKGMGWLTSPYSNSATHALNTLAAAYLLNLVLSLISVYLLARLFSSKWVAAIVALSTCVSLSWFARSSGHLNLTAFYVVFGIVYLALGSKRWSTRRTVATGAVVGILSSASYYYLYLTSLLIGCVFASFIALWLWQRRKNPGFPNPVSFIRKAIPGAIAAALIFGVSNSQLIHADRRFGRDLALVRSEFDISTFSNKEGDFFRVHIASPEHRVLGLRENSSMHGSNWTEDSVYLGIGGMLSFFAAIGFSIFAIRRRYRLEETVPLTLLFFWGYALSLGRVGRRFYWLLPMARVYSRIAILVLPAAILIVHVIAPGITENRRWIRKVVDTATVLLLLWPLWYGSILIKSLIPFRPDQTRALAYVDQAKQDQGPIRCLEFDQRPQCPLAFTDGFKLFLAARENVGILGVTLHGARTFSASEEVTQGGRYSPGECLKIPKSIYDASYPGLPGC
jgi:hypothetical protein